MRGWNPLRLDPIVRGALKAARHGIFVTCAAGNHGPGLTTVGNTAPWITTVPAGSIDRTFSASVVLGSGEVIFGESLYFEVIHDTEMLPIMRTNCTDGSSWVPSAIMGKIVVCTKIIRSTLSFIEAAGGAGLISINGDPLTGETITPKSYILPSLFLGYNEGRKLTAYLNLATEPLARLNIDGQTTIGKERAPQVASYSPRGPNFEMLELLKPDILAPGDNILAAWPSEIPEEFRDPRTSDFNI